MVLFQAAQLSQYAYRLPNAGCSTVVPFRLMIGISQCQRADPRHLLSWHSCTLEPLPALHLLVFLIIIVQLLVLFLKACLNLQPLQPILHGVSLVPLPPRQRRRRVHFEAEDSRLVAALGLGREHGGVYLEEDVVEGGAEVGAVDDGVARGFGVVEVLAARAVQLDGRGVGHVRLAHGQQRLRLAHDARALAKV